MKGNLAQIVASGAKTRRHAGTYPMARGSDASRPSNLAVVLGLILLPVVAGLAWCFYDAYWPRPLTLEAVYRVGGNGQILGGSDDRAGLHLPHPVADKALFITISNRSGFYLREAKVIVVAKDAQGAILAMEEAACLHLGREALKVLPAQAPAQSTVNCAVPLSKAMTRAINRSDFSDLDWYFSELRGHRAPVRLIRRPLEAVNLMFERIYD